MDFENCKEVLNKSKLVIFDFSAAVNISKSEMDLLLQLMLQSKIKVAVTDEFYENFNVVVKCNNDEQNQIAKAVIGFINAIDEKDRLFYIEDVYNNIDLLNQVRDLLDVVYILNYQSELKEALCRFNNQLRSNNFESCSYIVVNRDGLTDLMSFNEIVKQQEVDDSALSDDYFEIDDLPKENSRLIMDDGTIVNLGKFLAGGGEGAVYECDYKKDYLVKIYHDGQLTPLRVKKILRLEKKKVDFDGICWPERVVYTEKKEPVGFVMKKISGKAMSVVFDGCDSVTNEFKHWTRADLISLALDVLYKIQYLHLHAILIGDLRMNNIVLKNDGTSAIVDLDSCQIENFPCPAGFEDYVEAPLQGVDLTKHLRTYKNEVFSCAVIIFKILFCGLHPYDQKFGADSIGEEIALKSFPYPIESDGSYEKVVSGGYDNIWKITPKQMQMYFYDIFKNGKETNITEMIKMLETYAEFIKQNKKRNPIINKISFQ